MAASDYLLNKCDQIIRHVKNQIITHQGICISQPPVLCLVPRPGPNLYLTALAPNLYLPTLAPNLYLPTLAPNFYLRALVNPEPGLAYTNLISQICIYWPCPTIFITMLWICIYLLIYSGSSGYSNISNSSNFLGLENTNISMPILVN